VCPNYKPRIADSLLKIIRITASLLASFLLSAVVAFAQVNPSSLLWEDYDDLTSKTASFTASGSWSVMVIGDFGARDYAHAGLVWLEPDPLAHKYFHLSPYAYCADNPLRFVDPDGKFIDTLWDICFVVYDVYNLIVNIQGGDSQSINEGITALGMDLVSAFVPFLPAGTSTVLKVADAGASLKSFEHTAEFGVDTYKNLRKAVTESLGKDSGLEVHHLIEKRLANKIGVKEADIPSIVLTKEEHSVFTKKWKKEIGYSNSSAETTTKNATKENIREAVKEIYKDKPELIEQIENYLK